MSGGCCSPFSPGPGNQASFITANLTTLAALAGYPDGSHVFVLDQQEMYVLSAANTFVPFSPLIVTATGGGNWFRRSVQFVVSNFFLWVALSNASGGAGANKAVVGYGPGQQALTGTQALLVPDVRLDMSALLAASATYQPTDVTSDPDGNLWVTAWSSNGSVGAKLFRLPVSQILTTHAPTPDITLNFGAGSIAYHLFDKTNQLYQITNIAGAGGQKVNRIAQYAYQHSTTSQVSITGWTIAAAHSPQNPVFDTYGNLWLACFGAGASITQISAAQLASASGALVGAVVWTGAGLVGPAGIVMGQNTAAWVTDYATGGATSALKLFDATAVTGTPAPTITITSADMLGAEVSRFDTSGNIWVGSADNGSVIRIAAADLASSGVKVAALKITAPAGASILGMGFARDVQRSGLITAPLSL